MALNFKIKIKTISSSEPMDVPIRKQELYCTRINLNGENYLKKFYKIMCILFSYLL